MFRNFNLKQKAFLLYANFSRRIKYPEKYKTLSFFCDYAHIQDSQLNNKALAIKNKVISHICTPDSWFFPKNCACLIIRGQKDVDLAIKKGAAIIIADKEYDYPCIISDNPTYIYAKFCHYFRNLQQKVSVTAVTGSIGKTTTKNIIGTIYSSQWNTYYTSVNENTKTTIGFAIQHIPPCAEKMVQEVHEGNPGETQHLSEMLNPRIVVLTTIDKSHLARFENEDNIVEEVCSITKNMKENGKVIVNIDEFNRFDLLNGKTVVSISTKSNNADIYAENIKANEKGLSFNIVIRKIGQRYPVAMKNIYAPHNAICATLAFAAAYYEGMAPKKIIQAISTFKPQEARQNIIRTSDDIVIYADCYNATARSMKSAIDATKNIPTRGKKVAVLGDIEEAGYISTTIHQEVINHVNKSDFNVLLTIGEKMKKALSEVTSRNSLQVYSLDTIDQLNSKIKVLVNPGDLVLFKASHASNLTKCIKALWPQAYQQMFNLSNKQYEHYKKNCLLY